MKDTDNVYGDPVSKHSITYTEDGIKETEMRGFSSHCEVLSNSEGECCSMCSKTKDNLRRKHFRLEEYKDRPLFHRDATTSTCQGSSSSFKWKIYRNWEQQRNKIQSEMQDLDDLYSILKNVDKNDVPVLSRWFTYLTDRTFSCIDKKSACYSAINR